MKRFLTVLISLMFLFSMVTGCGNSIDKNKVTVLTGEFEGVFNPLFAESAGDVAVSDLVFDSVAEISESGDVIAGIADFEVLEDGHKYRFKLKNAKFSNGTLIKASDILFTLKVLADKDYEGKYDFSGAGIIGFYEYSNGNSDNISGFEIMGDGEFNIVLSEPNPKLLSMLTFGILSEEYYGEKYNDGGINALHELNSKPFGSGQYIFGTYENGQVKLVANGRYFKGMPEVDELTLVSDANEGGLPKFNLSETDYFASISKHLPEHNNFRIKNYVSNVFYNLGFNCKDPLFGDEEIRYAVSCAINSENISLKICNSEDGLPVIFNEVYAAERNQDKGAGILKEKGYNKNSDGFYAKEGELLEISISYEDKLIDGEIAKQIKEDAEKFGIKVNLKATENLTDKIESGSEQSFIICTEDGGRYFGASAFKTGQVENVYNFSNSEFDLMLEDYNKNSLNDGMKKIISEKVPCLPLYMKVQTIVYSKELPKIYASAHRSMFKNIYTLHYYSD